jgi:HEPN domain-containing protein
MAEHGRQEEARRWYLQGRHDLRAASWNQRGGFHDTACFLAQQAAEKVLKSLHYSLGSSRHTLLTHSVVELLRKAARRVPTLKEHLEHARELDLHYVPSRYPNGLPSGYPHLFYARETAAKALGASQAILAAVEKFYAEREILWDEEEGGEDTAEPEGSENPDENNDR